MVGCNLELEAKTFLSNLLFVKVFFITTTDMNENKCLKKKTHNTLALGLLYSSSLPTQTSSQTTSCVESLKNADAVFLFFFQETLLHHVHVRMHISGEIPQW